MSALCANCIGHIREANDWQKRWNELMTAGTEIRKERDELILALQRIANQDWRGNRTTEATLAHNALVKIGAR